MPYIPELTALLSCFEFVYFLIPFKIGSILIQEFISMKKTALLFALLSTTTANAGDDKNLPYHICSVSAAIAKEAMYQFQEGGVSKYDVIEGISDAIKSDLKEDFPYAYKHYKYKKLVEEIVQQAWEGRRYEKEARPSQIQGFTDVVLVNCYEMVEGSAFKDYKYE
ncbi:hypothetical protein M0D70_13845 [Acinetobacter portensis]|uniref:Uncharacterized protein n=2 Tax=Moraxellaceae TaxID=468 RepID=A0ABY4K1R5_9GAMM|nr:hypothetical protein [Acinetobacter portensis]MCK7641199.1 hypothetical protein [Acinetobacter portensis]UPO24935.1 hypothetical protein MZO21_14845 [Acinetobacter portensis]